MKNLTESQYEVLRDYLRPAWTAWQSTSSGRKRVSKLWSAGLLEASAQTRRWIEIHGVEHDLFVVSDFGRSAMIDHLKKSGLADREIAERMNVS